MTALLIFLTALLVALNGFFVIAEYALVRSRRARLESDAEEGQRGARLAVHQLDEINEYVSTIQVGITLASIGIGALGEPAFAHLFENWFGDTVSHVASVVAAAFLAYLIITSAHIIAGELVPKYYAIGHAEGVTRLVVTEDFNRDRVRGVVHANELARVLMSQGANASIDGVVHDAVIVPETKPLDDLLADLQRERSSLAVVVDEYGRVAGIVTVEDIVEEVVGEISDETDPAGGEVRRLANGDWLLPGHVAVTDLEDYGLPLPLAP